MKWFSATLEFKTVQKNKVLSEDQSVYLIEAPDWDEAFDASCELGEKEAFRYIAGDKGIETHYIFTSIITLDSLPDQLSSGTKIVNNPVIIEPYEYSEASPSSSEPTQTI